MKNPAIFYGGIVIAVIALILTVDYLIPNSPHLFADNAMHWKHAVLFFAIAVIGIIGALVNRPRSAA